MPTELEKLEYLAKHPSITEEHLIETTRLIQKINIKGVLDLIEELSLDSMLQLYGSPILKSSNKFEIIDNFKGFVSATHKKDIEKLKKNYETNGRLTTIEEIALNSIMELWNIL